MEHSAPHLGGACERNFAERMLSAVYGTCSHDLPNQVLSLQSLVNLIEMDEADRFDSTGREYLQRLRAVAEKTATLVEFLKTMVRLSRATPTPRKIDLADLVRELMAEARAVLSSRLEWRVSVPPLCVETDYDLVYPSLGDLLRAMTDRSTSTATQKISFDASKTARGVVLELSTSGLGIAAPSLEKRIDVILARERLRIAGVGLTLKSLSGGGTHAAFAFPHGTVD